MSVFAAVLFAMAAPTPTGDAATCLLRSAEGATRTLLEAEPASTAAVAAETGLTATFAKCGLAESDARDVALGAVAERWYRRARDQRMYRVLATREPTDPATSDELSRRRTVTWNPADAVAGCVVGLDGAGVQALLDTTAGSSSEQSSFIAMSSTMARCVDADQPGRFSRPLLRAAFARAFYRHYVASFPQVERMITPELLRAARARGATE